MVWRQRTLTTHPVGQKRPNAWGLYDMHGNVYEWCADWYGDNYYGESPVDDPAGPTRNFGLGRVARGGCWFFPAAACQSALRFWGDSSSIPPPFLGFRVVTVPLASPASPTSGAADGKWNLPPGAPQPAIVPFDGQKAKEHQDAWAKYLGVPVETTNSIGMKLVLIPPGEFDMGSTQEEVERLLAEAKQRNEPQWYIDHLSRRGSATSRAIDQRVLSGGLRSDRGPIPAVCSRYGLFDRGGKRTEGADSVTMLDSGCRNPNGRGVSRALSRATIIRWST